MSNHASHRIEVSPDKFVAVQENMTIEEMRQRCPRVFQYPGICRQERIQIYRGFLIVRRRVRDFLQPDWRLTVSVYACTRRKPAVHRISPVGLNFRRMISVRKHIDWLIACGSVHQARMRSRVRRDPTTGRFITSRITTDESLRDSAHG